MRLHQHAFLEGHRKLSRRFQDGPTAPRRGLARTVRWRRRRTAAPCTKTKRFLARASGGVLFKRWRPLYANLMSSMKGRPVKLAKARVARAQAPRRKSALTKKADAPKMFIVGVGASAGGLEAFTELLQHLPGDTGMAFVLVQHLDPVHESALAQILTRATPMPVREVRNNLKVEPNHIYIIPPNRSMAILKGVLKLTRRQSGRTALRSIDSFFESLAQEQGERAIGIVLSGTASDGTLGLEAIKAEGGITFAQDESAKYDSMPRSAIAAGCVDLVLAPQAIARELARMSRHPYVVNGATQLVGAVPPETEHEADQPSGSIASASERHRSLASHTKQARDEASSKQPALGTPEADLFKKILGILRTHCGVDFSLYKSNTIRRRIARRVVLNGHESLRHYLSFLKGNPKELDALYSDVLISVTSFFRNPESFEALKRLVFPKLLAQRGREGSIRVWTLGCSTGQEAYSIAIAYAECCDEQNSAPKLHIFATDLNDAMLDTARSGLYSKTLAQDMSPDRLRRFFVEEEGGYRVSKRIREQVVFARQNIMSDPPFSRMDLISCRNLLIYLEPGLQKSIMPALHYALRPDGFLFLGTNESIGSFNNLFTPVDPKRKIFSKKPAAMTGFRLPLPDQRSVPEHRVPTTVVRDRAEGRGPAESTRREFDAQREADRALLNLFAPPSVLVNSDFEILQFRGPTGPFLESPTGKATFNVLKMAREGLMLPLRSALTAARRDNQPVRKENVRVHQEGAAARLISLHVIPLRNLRAQSFLILFESPRSHGKGEFARVLERPKALGKRQESRRIAELERELSETRGYLQSIQEDHEATTEELQASSEEVQSANEELQSINEELETSKEELESTNEELTTVNEEMSNRNAELSRANADLNNLQLNMNTAVLLFSRNLTLRRFTPQAERIFNLLPTDVGRSVSGIRHNLDLSDLDHMLDDVIASLSFRELDVRDKDGRWYVMRLSPYLTVDNAMDGVVLVLSDITERKHGEEALGRLAAIVDSSADSIISTDLDGIIATWNRGAELLFGYSSNEAIGQWIGLILPKERESEVTDLLARVGRGEIVTDVHMTRRRKDGSKVEVSLTVSPVRNTLGEVVGVSKVDRDMTQYNGAMREREDLLKREKAARDEAVAANEAKDLFLATLSHEVRTPLNAIVGWTAILRSGKASAEDFRKGMDVIDRNCRLQARLIDDVLDVSSIVSGKLSIEVESTDLERLINATLDMLRPEAVDKTIELRIDLDPSVPSVVCDPARLQQATWNLLENAIKFTPPHGKVALTTSREGDYVRIAVTDTGAGIGSELLPLIFERYHQGERKIHSLGLGLSIVKHIVELHGGSVEALSAGQDRGATFVMRLPILGKAAALSGAELRAGRMRRRTAPLQSSSQQAPSVVPGSAIRLDGLRIVVVDDDEDARQVLRHALERAGAEVATCAAAGEAIAALNAPTTKRRMLISDLRMSGMDGIELIQNVRRRGETSESLPAIAMTAFARAGDTERVIAAGYQLHLFKPIDPFALIALIAGLASSKNN